MVSAPDFASSNLKLKKRSDFYVRPFCAFNHPFHQVFLLCYNTVNISVL